MERKITPGFWIAGLASVVMLVLIALENAHDTMAALLGAAMVLGVSFVGPLVNPNIFILDFETALEYVDSNVILLVTGMMIVIGILETTGIFQWTALSGLPALSGSRLARGDDPDGHHISGIGASTDSSTAGCRRSCWSG